MMGWTGGGVTARWLLVVTVMATALLPAVAALATSADELIDRFGHCGFQVDDQETVYAVDGSPTTIFRVWAEDQQQGTRGLVVYVYRDANAADGVFHALASVDRLEGVGADVTLDNGPLLERGAGRSVWRENVAVAQIMPMTSPTDLDALPDADLVRCLDGMP
jgi:hypothetical protein